MSNLVFYMEYGPLLCRVLKSAYVIYTYYDRFKNDEGIVQFTYNELNEHLGLATSTIQKSNAILRQLKLIEEVESSQGKKYKILPVKKLSSELKKEILDLAQGEDYSDDSSLRRRILQNDLPIDFQQLLNKRVLKKAYKDLGTLRSGKNLCNYFKIDYNTFKLLLEKEGENSFKTRFNTLAKSIEEDQDKQPKYTEQERDLAKYLYDKLSTLGAKPINKNWFIKNCNIAHTIVESITSEDAKQALDWGFEDDWWKDKITDLTAVNTLYSRYRLQAKKFKISRSTPIPPHIQEIIYKQVKTSIEVNTYEDAFMLKQSVLEGQDKEDILKIVNILEQNNIIPSGQENLKFG